MKEKDFSTEEKELFELLDWAIDYLDHGRFKNKEDKENAKISIKMFKDTKALITKCADKRQEDLIQIEEENNDHLHEYHDVT
jgi:primosomal protein N''